MLNIVVRNETARDLVLQFSGTDAGGVQRLSKSLVAACHIGVASVVLTERWTVRLDRTTILAFGEQPEVFDDPRSAENVTLRVSVDRGAMHMERLVPGIPGPGDAAGLIPGCV